MATLQQMLGRVFKAPAPKKLDIHRKAREEAKQLAKMHGIEIEAFKSRDGGGMNVWPPKADGRGRIHPGTLTDPWEGDHYCQDWNQTLEMVKHYAKFGTPVS